MPTVALFRVWLSFSPCREHKFRFVFSNVGGDLRSGCATTQAVLDLPNSQNRFCDYGLGGRLFLCLFPKPSCALFCERGVEIVDKVKADVQMFAVSMPPLTRPYENTSDAVGYQPFSQQL